MLGKQDGREDVALRAGLAGDAERLITEYGALWHARSRPGGFSRASAASRRCGGITCHR